MRETIYLYARFFFLTLNFNFVFFVNMLFKLLYGAFLIKKSFYVEVVLKIK